MEDRGSTQVGARLPGHIYRWLKQKVDNNDYPNMSQAVIGELTKAKLSEEMGARDKSNLVCEPTLTYDQEAYFRKQIGDILGELREAVLRGGEKK
jgi:hypothetical protein